MDYILNKENNKLLRCKFSVRLDQVNIKVIMTITSSQTYPSRNGIHSLLHWSKPACLRRFFCFIARHLSLMFLIHHKHSNLNKNQAICDQYVCKSQLSLISILKFPPFLFTLKPRHQAPKAYKRAARPSVSLHSHYIH